MNARIAIEPRDGGRTPRQNNDAVTRRLSGLKRAVLAAGGSLVPVTEANALLWLSSSDPDPLIKILNENHGIRWVQLPWAGVEKYAAAGVFHHATTFTCAKGSFATQVAEHALALTLACLRNLLPQARTRRWLEIEPGSLHGRRVTILGGGGIAAASIALLQPFGCEIRVIRRRSEPVPGAHATFTTGDLHAVLADTDVLIIALALTPETVRIIGAKELSALPPHAVVVNVARGEHIDTNALVDALQAKTIAAAALDVTDPEPMPDDHPLWRLDNALITSHCADSFDFVSDQLAARVQDNVGRFSRGEPLAGQIDPAAGY